MKTKLPLATTIHSAVYILSIDMLFTCSRQDKTKETPPAAGDKQYTELTLDPETQREPSKALLDR